jgi:chitin synthase
MPHSPQPPFAAQPLTRSPAPPYDPHMAPIYGGPSHPSPRGHPPPLSYGPSGPGYAPSPPVQQPIVGSEQYESSRLPFFEAALARSRAGHAPEASEPTVAAIPPYRYAQPVPLYMPPSDPNHPDLAVGFAPSGTIRFANGFGGLREPSRSPSPGMDDSFQEHERGDSDVEKALLQRTQPSSLLAPVEPDHWDEKLSSLGLMDDGDLSLPPFLGGDNVRSTGLGIRSIGAVVQGRTDAITDDNMADSTTQHFGPAPTGRVGRRTYNAAGHRRIKQKATLDENGFFAVDMPIPTRLAQFLPVKGVEEQKTTRCVLLAGGIAHWHRYTAVTTDPDDFPTSGLRLRQNSCTPPRQTELFIVITMYNEDAELFCRTLYGVMKNISHLCGRKNSRIWGKNGWQKVCLLYGAWCPLTPRRLWSASSRMGARR